MPTKIAKPFNRLFHNIRYKPSNVEIMPNSAKIRRQI